MSQKKTVIVNLVAGPCAGKTTMCAFLFGHLKMKGCSVEYVQEYAKHLVWTKDYETLNNQYLVTSTQFKLMKAIDSKVDIIVTDGSLLHGLYYNRYNKNNTSNVDKTEKLILDSFNQFKNIVIFLERKGIVYETEGRIESEREANFIDEVLVNIMEKEKIPYISMLSDPSKENIDKIIQIIMQQM